MLKRGGTVIITTGPPDPAFTREGGAHTVVRLAVAALSYRIRRRARRHQVTYSYLFMKAGGDRLRELAAEIIRPFVDSAFDFGQICEAMAHLGKDAPRTHQGRQGRHPCGMTTPDLPPPVARPPSPPRTERVAVSGGA
ncbi:MDR/zinc-dependent alcohol dehydrogenase-like family protein [Streptomyces akebiae]|uniref:Uncharacterized protein n=1 Tax=Streptomyces akebiae TaxID=2865673 RepID=A0ABX8Y103_9ACTN|nr:hypothetical protein [Streptomyces akebiae]QYX81863.1 hypothetical protein K1J60_39645 [Streptomyces akebiae]